MMTICFFPLDNKFSFPFLILLSFHLCNTSIMKYHISSRNVQVSITYVYIYQYNHNFDLMIWKLPFVLQLAGMQMVTIALIYARPRSSPCSKGQKQA